MAWKLPSMIRIMPAKKIQPTQPLRSAVYGRYPPGTDVPCVFVASDISFLSSPYVMVLVSVLTCSALHFVRRDGRPVGQRPPGYQGWPGYKEWPGYPGGPVSRRRGLVA